MSVAFALALALEAPAACGAPFAAVVLELEPVTAGAAFAGGDGGGVGLFDGDSSFGRMAGLASWAAGLADSAGPAGDSGSLWADIFPTALGGWA